MTRLRLDDPTDQRVAIFMGLRDHDLRRLRESEGGDMEGVFVAESDLIGDRAIAAGFEPICVLVDASTDTAVPTRLSSETPIYLAGPQVVSAITGYQTHRGALIAFKRRALPTLDQVIAGANRIVVTESVVNPTNMGVIVRSAAAFGFGGLIFDSSSCDPLYRRAIRASMGAGLAIPHVRAARSEAIDQLQGAGFTVVALSPKPEAVDLANWMITRSTAEPIALLLGSEGPGLSAAAEQAADLLATIPIAAEVDSLNVGVAAGIACYLVGSTSAKA